MSQHIIDSPEEALSSERSRIVGLCATLTGNSDAAEDLAQEVMLEAWRSLERLRNPAQFSHWLSGIARNVCLRWSRQQGRHLAHLAPPPSPDEAPLAEQLASTFDIEIELERKELTELLDRALAALPPATRAVIIARYIEESSLAEVAERLDLQTGAVAMRLQRGKLALRRVLSSEIGAALPDYALPTTSQETTSAWCTLCGQHHLLGAFKPEQGTLFLSCPACGEYSHTNFAHTTESDLFHGMQRVRPALSRLRNWTHNYYRENLDSHAAPCLRCGRELPLVLASSLRAVDTEHLFAHWRDEPGVYQFCPHCHLHNWTSLNGLALALPAGQRFLRDHPRVRTLPTQHVAEVAGHHAIVTRFESATSPAHFEVVSAIDSYHVLLINGVRP